MSEDKKDTCSAAADRNSRDLDPSADCLCQGMMPKLDFSTFVMSLSSTALVHLGEVPEPESGTFLEDISLAKQTIDVLCMLAAKTKGNLDANEERLLKDILFELRMKYVQKKD